MLTIEAIKTTNYDDLYYIVCIVNVLLVNLSLKNIFVDCFVPAYKHYCADTKY